MPDDPYRYCVYCGVDCYHPWADDHSRDYADDVEHGRDCPTVTGLFPVTAGELGMRGPGDRYAHGMCCMDCGDEFDLGDVYALRPTEDDDVYEVVCVGCRVLNTEAVDV